jgi:predicted RNase H-like nuclease (RuvC/YqgF family)
MQRIIKAIEEKLTQQENTIYWKDCEINDLKRKLEEAEKTIEAQAQEISALKEVKSI